MAQQDKKSNQQQSCNFYPRFPNRWVKCFLSRPYVCIHSIVLLVSRSLSCVFGFFRTSLNVTTFQHSKGLALQNLMDSVCINRNQSNFQTTDR